MTLSSLTFTSVYCKIGGALAKFEIETTDHKEAINEVIEHIKETEHKQINPILALIEGK